MPSKYTTPHTKPLTKKQQLIKDLCDRYPHYNLKSNLIGGLFLVGLILIIWEISIFRMTFISIYVPLSMWIVSGIMIKPFFKKTLNSHVFNPSSPGYVPAWLQYIYNFISFGGIIVFLFIWSQTIDADFRVARSFYHDLNYYYPNLQDSILKKYGNKISDTIVKLMVGGIREGYFIKDLNPALSLKAMTVLYSSITRTDQYKNLKLSANTLAEQTVFVYLRGICTEKGLKELNSFKKNN